MWQCVGGVVAVDGVARGGTGSVVVLWCVCTCMGRVVSVANVARQQSSGWLRKMEEDRMGI